MLIILNFAKLCFAPEVHFPQHSRPEQVPVLQKSISRHSNIAVVLVQVNVDNSITEGEEKRKIVASSCKGPGLSSESENTPLL